MRGRKTSTEPLIDRMLKRIEYVDGHWVWTGYFRRGLPIYVYTSDITREYILARQYFAKLDDPNYTKTNLYPTCGRKDCVNPKHTSKLKPLTPFKQEILALWHKSEAAKKLIVTMDDLGKQFGVTRQRIQQIISNLEDNNADSRI